MAAFKRRRSKPLRFITAPLPVDHPSWLDLDRQLPPDHLARRIRFLVEQLDLDSLLETYSGVGGALYPPDLLLAFVLFETQRGRLSPAQWFTDSRESIPGRWLLRGLLPTRSTFYRFRKHLPAELVDDLNRSVLLLAQAEGHTTADNGSLDGTFTAAYGSRHRLLNRITLARRLHMLDDAIATSGLLPPMLERTRQLTGRKVTKVRGDGIYASLKDVRYCKENSVALYAPLERGSVPVTGAGGPQEQGKDRAAGGKAARASERKDASAKSSSPGTKRGKATTARKGTCCNWEGSGRKTENPESTWRCRNIASPRNTARNARRPSNAPASPKKAGPWSGWSVRNCSTRWRHG